MMKTKCVFLGLFFFLNTFSVRAEEASKITSPEDIIRQIELRNADLSIIQENVRQAEASLGKLKGKLYFPSIHANASYVDSQRAPSSPFQSARRKDLFWQLYLESKLPLGLNVIAGQAATRSFFGQANPPNPQLPYPATYYQPEVFVEASLNLTQDLLGYVTRRELSAAEKQLNGAHEQEQLLKHKLTLTALSLYYQLPLLERIRDDSRAMIRDFQKLENSVHKKTERELAEKSDLLNIRSLIASQQASLQSVEQTFTDVKSALILLLGNENLSIETNIKNEVLSQNIEHCEQALVSTTFADSLSDESVLLGEEIARAKLQSEIDQRKLWPELSLQGRVTSTGNASDYTSGFDEVRDFNNPVYEIGLNFSWQPSPQSFRAGKKSVHATQSIANFERQQRTQELHNLWSKAQETSKTLHEKYLSGQRAEREAEAQIAELDKQYYRGRISLFEFTQQKMRLLQASMSVEKIQQERLANLMQTLQYFNRFECPLVKP